MNDSTPSIGCVVMAAGNSIRFGANKLEALVNGKTLVEYALDALPVSRLQETIVVTQYDSVESLARKYGFTCIRNPRPEDGVSLTIRLGTKALMESCDAIMYLVADQPLLKQESVARLIDCFLDNPDHIVSAAYDGRRGNPCIFPQKYFDELLNLKGDTGGSSVIRSHPEELMLCEVDPEELLDIDTAEDILKL